MKTAVKMAAPREKCTVALAPAVAKFMLQFSLAQWQNLMV